MKSITMWILIFVTVCFFLALNRQNVEHLQNVENDKAIKASPVEDAFDDNIVIDGPAEEIAAEEAAAPVQVKKDKQKAQGATGFLGNNRTQQLDELYENTTTYENEEGREGLDICLEKCRGNCVEFGIHGRAFCFAADK